MKSYVLGKKSFNREFAKTLTKSEFMERNKHLADEKTLGAEYDKIVPPKEAKADKK